MARRRRGLSAAALRVRVEQHAGHRCEYCRAPQRVSGYRFHLEHVVPRTLGGSDGLPNRALACATCNLAKGDRTTGIDPRGRAEVDLFKPRIHVWDEHFRWAGDRQTLLSCTPIGRATVAALDMNNALHREARRLWFETGWLPQEAATGSSFAGGTALGHGRETVPQQRDNSRAAIWQARGSLHLPGCAQGFPDAVRLDIPAGNGHTEQNATLGRSSTWGTADKGHGLSNKPSSVTSQATGGIHTIRSLAMVASRL